MKNSGKSTKKALEYAIESIKSGYVRSEEPEYSTPPSQRNYCKVQSLDEFDVSKL